MENRTLSISAIMLLLSLLTFCFAGMIPTDAFAGPCCYTNCYDSPCGW